MPESWGPPIEMLHDAVMLSHRAVVLDVDNEGSQTSEDDHPCGNGTDEFVADYEDHALVDEYRSPVIGQALEESHSRLSGAWDIIVGEDLDIGMSSSPSRPAKRRHI
jgi:hypothetical protein